MQTARRPRHLVLLVVATLFAALFVALGVWQYQVAHQDAREKVLQAGPRQPVVPLEKLVSPHQNFPNESSLRRVSITGTYDADKTFLVPDRRLNGAAGYWVVTPLVVESTGARLPVLRGFVTEPAERTPAPTGQIRLIGSLAPSESPISGANLPAGQLASVDVATLLNQWGGDVYNAFVFVVSQTPAEQSGAMRHVPPPTPSVGGVDWRNFGYALQWWVFAMFAFYLWWRSVREDHLDQLALKDPGTPADANTDDRTEDVHV